MRNIGIEYAAPGQMRFRELGQPQQLGPNDILIETRYSGITNGTERHALVGEFGWRHFPGCHGYQNVGTVAACGEAVSDFTVGDWVFCGQYIGHRGWIVADVSGADPRSNGSHLVVKLPEDVDKKQCALLGVAGVSMRGVKRLRIGIGQNVWVVGAGLIGQFAAQAARVAGAEVTVTDFSDERLRRARECGAHRPLNARESSTLETLQATGPFDAIIDASGLPSLFHDIHNERLLTHGGVIGAMAVRGNAEFPWSMLHMLEASIEVSCHFSMGDIKGLLRHLEIGNVHVAPLITHDVSIDDAPEVYATLRDNPGGLLGVVFDWR